VSILKGDEAAALPSLPSSEAHSSSGDRSIHEVDEAAAYREEEGYERGEFPSPDDDDLAKSSLPPSSRPQFSDAAAHANIHAGALACTRW
jgi:hypothetical protein